MGKVVYSWFIQRDEAIADTVVRSTTIPEELGRIQYLLTDKTGTLTQNEMIFKKLHLGSVSFSAETMDDVTQLSLASLCMLYKFKSCVDLISGDGVVAHRLRIE